MRSGQGDLTCLKSGSVPAYPCIPPIALLLSETSVFTCLPSISKMIRSLVYLIHPPLLYAPQGVPGRPLAGCHIVESAWGCQLCVFQFPCIFKLVNFYFMLGEGWMGSVARWTKAATCPTHACAHAVPTRGCFPPWE